MEHKTLMEIMELVRENEKLKNENWELRKQCKDLKTKLEENDIKTYEKQLVEDVATYDGKTGDQLINPDSILPFREG